MRLVMALLVMSISTMAHAEIFMCKDAAGHTYTSDRPIPECAGRAVREYANNGMLKKRIAAPLTAEQQKAQAAQEEKKKAELLEQQEQRHADRALLARYHNEHGIEQSRQRDVQPIEKQIEQQNAALTAAGKEQQVAQTALNARMEVGTVPAGFKLRAAQTTQAVRIAQAELDDSKARLAEINKKYDLLLQRYRELTDTTKTAALH
jgi:hypothetical protein